MKSIVVVGSINLDLVAQVPRLPRAGETLSGSDFAMSHGGKGANQAVAAARLQAPTALIGCVGDDAFGQTLQDGLCRAGVDVRMVTRQPGPSGVALIQVDANRENSITVIAGANDRLTPALLSGYEQHIANAGMVLTQLEVPLETVKALATFCTRHGVPLMLDPAPVRELPRSLIAQVKWLTPNLGEACHLLQRKEPAHCTPHEAVTIAQSVLQLGPANVLLKVGSQGLVALGTGGSVFIPPFPVQVVDTTGAGDATNASFAVALLEGMPLNAAARFAAAAGASAVTRPGAQSAMPSRNDVLAILERQT